MSAAHPSTTTLKQPDTRNLVWRSNNVGAKLLQKMGWQDGQAVGKRQRHSVMSTSNSTTSSSTDHGHNHAMDTTTTIDATTATATDSAATQTVSSEGIRVMRRPDGLGLGATTTMGLLAPSAQPHHVQHFADLLQHLKQEHQVDVVLDTKTKKRSKSKLKKSSKTTLTATPYLPTNKSTHTKVRQAKFQEKTADELKCIFGGVTHDLPILGTVRSSLLSDATQTTTSPKKSSQKQKRDGESSKERQRKKLKKDKK